MRPPALLLAAAVVTAAPALPGWARDPDPILERILGFERRIGAEPDEARRIAMVREFVAGLDSAADKRGFLGALDSRYVYVVPERMLPELLDGFLHYPDPSVRCRAAHTVGYRGLGLRYEDELLKLLDTTDPERKRTSSTR